MHPYLVGLASLFFRYSPVYGILHIKDPFEKSRVIIGVAGFSLCHRCSQRNLWMCGVGDPDGSSLKNRPNRKAIP